MTREKQLQELKALTEMAFGAASSEAQRLTTRQAELKSMLADLRTEDAAVRQYLAENIHLRAAQIDVPWQAWLGRQLRALNEELAQVTVQRERQMRSLRQAFGKKEAAALLAAPRRTRQTD